MRIHKAWYGPKGGHALLSSTEASLQTVFRQASWLTDLPDTAPAGLQWQPYFRTAIHDSYFVLVHTRSSVDSSRPGMVDSVAAFVPLAELPQVPDMRRLAENLKDSHDEQVHEPYVPDDSDGQQSPAEETPSPMLLAMANGLVSPQARPLVHVGQEGFDDVMLNLLQLVPVQLRREVLFGLSFSPKDAGQAFAVWVPQQLASRFSAAQVVAPADEAPSARVAALLKMPQGRPLLEFGEAAGFDLQMPNALALMEQAYELWTGDVTVERAVPLVRLLAAKTSDSPSAQEIRNTAIQRLVSTQDKWTPPDVLTMRNLPLERFDSDALTQALQAWVTQRAANPASVTADDCRLLGEAAQAAAKQKWWNTRVQAGFLAASRTSPAEMSSLAWATFATSTADVPSVIALMASAGLLSTLATSVPAALTSAVADAVAEASAARHAWLLCAAVLASAYKPEQALRKLLAHNIPKGDRRTAVARALARAEPAQLLGIALREDIEDVTTLAADAVCGTPSLLQGFDWTFPVWFDILQKVFNKKPAALSQIPERRQGLQAIIGRGEASERIWGPIVRSGSADLSSVANRAQAWALIPQPIYRDVVTQSAKGWLTSLADGTAAPSALEEPLASEVSLALRGSSLLTTAAQKTPALFIYVINELYPRSDWDCASLLDSLGRTPRNSVATAAATGLGLLIKERSWRSAASTAARYGRTRDDFLPMCKECFDLISLWDRWPLYSRMGEAHKVGAEEAWSMFEETLVSLYPTGPTQEEFWSRCGGKNEDLDLEGAGVGQWHRCLKLVRSGKGPRPAALLRMALRDYGGNAVLQVLSDSRALD